MNYTELVMDLRQDLPNVTPSGCRDTQTGWL